MNTLRISKGKDIKICADGEQLFFVTDFFAEENVGRYKISEFMSMDEVDSIVLKKNYKLTLTALSHLNSRVFSNDNFTVTVYDIDKVYEYSDCHLECKKRQVSQNKPVVDVYTIVASKLNIKEVSYE